MAYEDMKERIVVQLSDGKMYAGEVYSANVRDGQLMIAVKGKIPIMIPVTEVSGSEVK